MRVFISWSGDRSREFAEFLQEWLPTVVPNSVEVFVSSQSIAKGERGMSVLAQQLETHDYGIVVLTAASQHAPWVLFEAGALSKSVTGSRLTPLLIDLSEADVSGPLAQFQMTNASSRSDVERLVLEINRTSEAPSREQSVRMLFESTWAEFDSAVASARASAEEPPVERSQDDMIAEILDVVRDMHRDTARTARRGRAQASARRQREISLTEALSRALGTRPSIQMVANSLGHITEVHVAVQKGELEGTPDGASLQSIADDHRVKINVYDGSGAVYISIPRADEAED